MTEPNLTINKKKRITYIASIKGVEKAENALRRIGFKSKAKFAESQLLSRSTVTKFFVRQAIQLDSFERICDALKLKWEEIREIEEISAPSLDLEQCSTPIKLEEVGEVISGKQVTVIDKNDKKTKAVIILEGDIHSISDDLFIAIKLCLKEFSGHTIKITKIKPGSIKIFIEGSQEDIEKLVSYVESGEITEINSFPVKSIQILNESSDNTESENKWCLVKEIKAQGTEGRNLKDADLSDADLSDADLSDANLSDAILSNADLIGANLSNANLSNVDLSNANLSNAILIGANLIGANLIGANLIFANLSDANLSNVNLSGTNLNRAYLSNADLSNADLSGADLSGADLSNADLSSADLILANLRGANLILANLRGANVTNTQFGNNEGISVIMKQELIKRGAIFEDSPGDRSRVLV